MQVANRSDTSIPHEINFSVLWLKFSVFSETVCCFQVIDSNQKYLQWMVMFESEKPGTSLAKNSKKRNYFLAQGFYLISCDTQKMHCFVIGKLQFKFPSFLLKIDSFSDNIYWLIFLLLSVPLHLSSPVDLLHFSLSLGKRTSKR